jgi:hypothetical protein
MRDALKAADLAANAGFDVGEIGEPEAMARPRGMRSSRITRPASVAVPTWPVSATG